MTFEQLLFSGAALILISVLLLRVSGTLGLPTLILFLLVGILAGSEGPGGIEFDDPSLARAISTVALIIILFSGGLDTKWSQVRPVLVPALSLATLGVILTAGALGAAVHWLLGLGWPESLLLASVVSSTDAAAVFSVMRARGGGLRPRVRSVVELESGSNDPMAVVMTLGLIHFITVPNVGPVEIGWMLGRQVVIGLGFGWAGGRIFVLAINRLRLPEPAVYPVFSLAFALFIFSAADLLKGSGFLAVYVAGVLAGNHRMLHEKNLLRFFEGIAWFSHISMFLALGLLVFPSRLVGVWREGIFIAVFLMFVARPLGVFLSLLFMRFNVLEKLFISWVGLRGSVPIILATFVLTARIPVADVFFNIVFFIVLFSSVVQGWSLPLMAKVLRQTQEEQKRKRYPIELENVEGLPADMDLTDYVVPYGSPAIGKPLVSLGLPPNALVVLLNRDDRFMVPSGATELQSGDALLVLADLEARPIVHAILNAPVSAAEKRTD